MYIQDTPVYKQYWEPFLNFISKKWMKHDYVHIEGTNVYLMWWKYDRVYVIADVGDDGALYVYGWYFLQQQEGWEAWEIQQSYIFADYRGAGLTNILHDVIINRESLTLASGPCQTKLARRMWKRMVMNEEFTIWAHDFVNLNSWAPVTYDPDNDDLWCKLPVYDVKWNPDRDIRLIAIRKRHDNRLCGASGPPKRNSIPGTGRKIRPRPEVLPIDAGGKVVSETERLPRRRRFLLSS